VLKSGRFRVQRLPKTISEEEVDLLLETPDISRPLGLRDRAMLEVLYATGVRVSELVAMTIDKLNLREGLVLIEGKGKKERLLPVGEMGIIWLQQYIENARPKLLAGHSSPWLFIHRHGKPLSRQAFWYVIKRHAKKRVLQRPSHLMYCGMPLRRIYWQMAQTCEPCRCFWVTAR